MKILKETTDPQTLSFIPREYPSSVDIELHNEETQEDTTLSGLTATTLGGYLSVTEVFDLKEGSFYSFKSFAQEATGFRVKTIAANQELLFGNDATYIGATSDTLDVDITYLNIDTVDSSFILYIGDSGSLISESTAIQYNPSVPQITVFVNKSISERVQVVIPFELPSSGKISLKGFTGGFNVLVDDVVIHTENTTIDTSAYDQVLRLSNLSGNYTNIEYSRVRVNGETWDFTEGSGSTTTSDGGKVLTLNSNVSVDDMWQGELGRGEEIYKGKIFCTNQDPKEFSINKDRYKEDDSKKTYITYEG